MEIYVVFVITLISTVPFSSHACDFPEFVQSRRGGPERSWHVEHLSYYRGRQHKYSHVVTFREDVMSAQINGEEHRDHDHTDLDRPKSFVRRCVIEVVPGQFLVTHNDEHGSLQRYMCIQFLKRSDTVVQVRHSELSDVQNLRLCSDESMRLDDWPLINKVDLFASYVPCPLQGGYFTRFYEKETHKGFCDVYEGETLLESECMKEEGMYFRFRYDECIPDGVRMKTDQRVFCMADWEHEDYRFVVLRHDTEDRQWCLRYPSKLPKKFNAALFYDVVCDPNAPKDGKNSFLSMTMQRAPVQSMEQLCVDDYEACSYWSQACSTPGSAPYMTCAKTCNICNETRPSRCRFPANIWGEWLESNRDGHDIVEIKDRSISKYEYDDFQCVTWGKYSHVETMEHMEQMLVTTFDNGCKPRYSCVELKMHSPSVLHYKLSVTKVWPFYDEDWQNIDCSTFHYRDEPEPLLDIHRSRHMKVLISMDSITNIDCGLEEPLAFTMTVDNDVTCHGMLTSKDTTVYKDKRLQLLLYDCPNRPGLQEFTCLDSHRHGYMKRQITITESVLDTNDYQCWYFPVAPEHTFYLLPMMHCNEGAGAKVVTGDLAPLTTFNVKYIPTTTTTTTTITIAPRPSEDIEVENIIGLPDSNNKDPLMPRNGGDSHHPNEVEIVPGTKDALSAGPSQSDTYSHLGGEGQPDEERLVSPDSGVEGTRGKPQSRDVSRTGPLPDPANSSAATIARNTALLLLGTVLYVYL